MMKKIATCFTFLFSACFHHQCDTIRLDKNIDKATEIKEINIDKENKNVSFEIIFLGKYSSEYKLADIYNEDIYYDGNLVHSDEEFLLDSLSKLNISRFIIQVRVGRSSGQYLKSVKSLVDEFKSFWACWKEIPDLTTLIKFPFFV